MSWISYLLLAVMVAVAVRLARARSTPSQQNPAAVPREPDEVRQRKLQFLRQGGNARRLF